VCRFVQQRPQQLLGAQAQTFTADQHLGSLAAGHVPATRCKVSQFEPVSGSTLTGSNHDHSRGDLGVPSHDRLPCSLERGDKDARRSRFRSRFVDPGDDPVVLPPLVTVVARRPG